MGTKKMDIKELVSVDPAVFVHGSSSIAKEEGGVDGAHDGLGRSMIPNFEEVQTFLNTANAALSDAEFERDQRTQLHIEGGGAAPGGEYPPQVDAPQVLHENSNFCLWFTVKVFGFLKNIRDAVHLKNVLHAIEVNSANPYSRHACSDGGSRVDAAASTLLTSASTAQGVQGAPGDALSELQLCTTKLASVHDKILDVTRQKEQKSLAALQTLVEDVYKSIVKSKEETQLERERIAHMADSIRSAYKTHPIDKNYDSYSDLLNRQSAYFCKRYHLELLPPRDFSHSLLKVRKNEKDEQSRRMIDAHLRNIHAVLMRGELIPKCRSKIFVIIDTKEKAHTEKLDAQIGAICDRVMADIDAFKSIYDASHSNFDSKLEEYEAYKSKVTARMIELQLDLPDTLKTAVDDAMAMIRKAHVCRLSQHNHELHASFMKHLAPLLVYIAAA